MNMPLPVEPAETVNKSRQVLERQKSVFNNQSQITYQERIAVLNKVESILLKNDEEICQAISTDFGNRSYHETRILEIAPSLMGLRYTRKKLKKWMKAQKRHVSPVFLGAKNRVIPQAKGIVGIVAPWNYPLFLALSPLTSAIAAGNRVMIKQAANSQNLSRLLQEKFSAEISEDLIAFLPGVASHEFSTLPFDHLVFTGSPEVGKTIMKVASENLVPVTLELGGKSPTIIADDFDLQKAAERILFAKLINAGQTCIAPDHLFVPEGKVKQFVEIAKRVVAGRYADLHTKDYTNIIDQRSYTRLLETLEDAKRKKAKITNLLSGPQADDSLRKISPTIVTSVNEEMAIMQREIFGPLLPVLPYRNLDEVVEYINSHERPLALYLFSNSQQTVDRVLEDTRSGGVSINDCALHVAQHDMPFGGTGNSGMGSYHGYEGFVEFSKLRPVFRQARKNLAITPPYGKTFDRIYNLVKKVKWLS